MGYEVFFHKQVCALNGTQMYELPQGFNQPADLSSGLHCGNTDVVAQYSWVIIGQFTHKQLDHFA